MNNYVEIDIETSGLDERVDEIIRLSAIKIVNGAVADKFSAFCKPNKPLRKEVEILTGITNDVLNDKPTIRDVLPNFLRFIGDATIGARNVAFDVRFINAALERANMPPIKNEIIDTYSLAKESIIKKLIMDSAYAEFLCAEKISDIDVIKLICHAPISLFEKRDLYRQLSGRDFAETGSLTMCGKYLSVAERVIEDMKLPKEGTFLLVGHSQEKGEEQFECLPFRSYEKAEAYLTETFKDGAEKSVWYTLEKWLPKDDVSLDLIEVCEFTFIGDKPCFYKNLRYFYNKELRAQNKSQMREENEFTLFSSRNDLNLPTPFNVGDVLRIDCRPFAPETTVTVTNNNTPSDCCYPQCEYVDKNGRKQHGALKHSHIYKESVIETFSPLYNLVWEKKK